MGFLTRFSLKNATVVFLSILLIALGGWYSAREMKSEALPDIDVPYIVMHVVYPGATPHDVSKEITEPLEKALQGVNGVKNLTTYANQNYGVVVMEFEYSANMEKAWQDVNSTVQGVELPKEAQKPELQKANVNNPDIIRFAVSGPGSQEEIARYLSDVVKPKLAAIDGVDKVNVGGVMEKKIFIKLDPDKMKEYQVNPESVKQTLQFAELSIPAGQVTLDDKLMAIEVKKGITTLDDIKNIRLVSVDTSKVFQDAFGAVGDGFSQVTGAMKQLGQGMAQGFSALGSAQATAQTQIQYLSGIQTLTSTIGTLKEQLAAIHNPPDNPEMAQQKAVLEGQIKALEQKLKGLQAELDIINKQVLAEAQKGGQSAGSFPAAPKAKSSKKGLDMGSPETKVVTLKDVAQVSYGYEKKTFLTRTDGKPGVEFAVTRQQGGNVAEISDKVKEKVDSLKLPKDYNVDILYDLAEPIKQSVKSMVREGLLGALFAVIIIFVFLRNFRSTIVAITAIPLSLLATFIVLKWFDYTVNIMTLSGMAVAVGRVVDDSIVVIENIFRRISNAEQASEGLVREATGEVAGAITSSTLTTIAVFGPLTMVSGIIGKVFTPFAVTVVVSLIFSLLVAVTVVPLMARLLLMKARVEERGDGRIREGYGKVLLWALNHKLVIIGIALATLAGSLGLATQIGTNFLPQDKVRIYEIGITMPVGASLEKTDGVARKVEKILAEKKGVKTYSTSVGDNGSGKVFVVFKDDVEDTKGLSEEIRSELKKVTGARDIGLQGVGGPGGNPWLQIVVNGNDFASIKKGGEQIIEAIKDIPGLANINSNLEDIKPQIEIKVNEPVAAQKGLSPIMVAGTIRAMISGDSVAKVNMEGKPTDMVLSVNSGNLPNIEAIKKLELLSMTGAKVPVSDVATVDLKPGPTSIQRRNLQDFATINGLITDDNSGKVSTEAQKKLEKIKLPEGVTYSFEGSTQMMADGFHDMGVAMGVAVLLVFIVMVGTFGNAMAPLSILFSLPMAIIGALLGLFISGEELGMPALIGGLMLIGIVVTNAIVFVDRVQHQRANGLHIDEALVEAGKTRLRPIIMTAVTTIFALAPLAVMPAEGALVSKSMAVVVIGGLTTSTLLTLVVVPVVYKIFDNILCIIRKRFSGNVAEEAVR